MALRYAVNADLIFKGLRDARYAPDPAAVPLPSVEPHFLPVKLVAEALMAVPTADNQIEIELAGGRRMRISGNFDLEALARLVRGLTV